MVAALAAGAGDAAGGGQGMGGLVQQRAEDLARGPGQALAADHDFGMLNVDGDGKEFGLFGRESVVMVRPRAKSPIHERERCSSPSRSTARLPTIRSTGTALARWMTGPSNAYFARSVVNRYVSYLLGHGLVEPVDDLRATNPASNAELLDALAKHFVDSGFDLKQLVRVIMTSRLYQLDSQPSLANASDRKFYSHFTVKRLAAEALLDAVDEATGTRTKFTSLPLGTRAIELPDAEYQNYFLKTFGKPVRASVCECERSADESLAQAMHTLNGDIVTGKIADPKARVARLLAVKAPGDRIVEELYLSTLAGSPPRRNGRTRPSSSKKARIGPNATRTCSGPSSTRKTFYSSIKKRGHHR